MRDRDFIRMPVAALMVGLVAVGVCLAGCTTLAAAPFEDDAVVFDRYEIVTGAAKRQMVLAGNFLGGDTAELLLVQMDENADRRLHLYGFDGGAWVPLLDATLPAEVLFVDMAHSGGRDRLLTYEHGRLSWFDPQSETQRGLLDVTTNYNATQKDGIPRVDITRDLNRDGRDDVVLPDLDGFWVSIQLSDGTFSDAVKLGPAEPFLDEKALNDGSSYREVGITAENVPWYLSRVHQMDHNLDGRSDLVFWNQDHFDVYLQNERGLFEPTAKAITADVPFDSDGAYSRMFEFSDESTFSVIFGLRKNSKQTVMHSLRDINGDGVADLVTLALSGRSIARQRSVYQVHFGTPTPDGTVFARDVGTAIHPRGIAGGMQPWGYSSQQFMDFDGDGLLDIMFRDVTVGFGGMSRALLANSIAIDLEFYRNEGAFPDQPSARRRIRPDLDPFGQRGPFFPVVLPGDVNGDGRVDLVVGQNWEELHVFLGMPGPDLLAHQPQSLAVPLPKDERNIRLVDLNRDGKDDILVHHASATEPHRVMTLIAR